MSPFGANSKVANGNLFWTLAMKAWGWLLKMKTTSNLYKSRLFPNNYLNLCPLVFSHHKLRAKIVSLQANYNS